MRILIYWQVIDLGKEGFERLMGIHGAPFLMGLRPACLLSFQQSKFTDFEGMLAEYQHCFQCKGIAQCRLAEGEEYVMILFYRSAALARMLWLPESAALLQELGYLDDEAYAKSFASDAARKGKGRLRIARELAQKGADAATAKAAIEAAAEEEDQLSERERAMEAARKILRGQEKPDEKTLARIGRRLSSLGYEPSVIWDVLGKLKS